MITTACGIAILVGLDALVLRRLFRCNYQGIFFAEYFHDKPDFSPKEKTLADELGKLCVHGFRPVTETHGQL